jgi:hypothetical protein
MCRYYRVAKREAGGGVNPVRGRLQLGAGPCRDVFRMEHVIRLERVEKQVTYQLFMGCHD